MRTYVDLRRWPVIGDGVIRDVRTEDEETTDDLNVTRLRD
jgi:hypothetical protein